MSYTGYRNFPESYCMTTRFARQSTPEKDSNDTDHCNERGTFAKRREDGDQCWVVLFSTVWASSIVFSKRPTAVY